MPSPLAILMAMVIPTYCCRTSAGERTMSEMNGIAVVGRRQYSAIQDQAGM